MKKILSLVIVLIAIGQVNANGVEPNSPTGMSVIKKGSIVKLYYRGEEAGKVKVKISNEDGDIVHLETLQNTDGFMRPYNLSFLPEGEYTIQLIDEKGTRTHKIMHSFASATRIAHLSRLKDGGNKFLLLVPNEGQDSLTIKIYDDANSLVYEDTQEIHTDFAKVYTLKQIAGKVSFEVTDSDGKVTRITR
jgi:hypothetical protein